MKSCRAIVLASFSVSAVGGTPGSWNTSVASAESRDIVLSMKISSVIAVPGPLTRGGQDGLTR